MCSGYCESDRYIPFKYKVKRKVSIIVINIAKVYYLK